MKGLFCVLLCLCLMGTATWGQAAEEDMLYAQSLALLEHIRQGEEDAALAMMDEVMKAAMGGQIAAMWGQLAGLGGEFKQVNAHQILEEDGYRIVVLELGFEAVSLLQRTVFDAQGKVAGLFFSPGSLNLQAAQATPPGLEEIALRVDAGEGYPLDALLTLPQGDIIAGLVLVHGSGPSDKDEAIGANAPFRDLAWGLASRGIATLRFDKRSYSYGAQMAQSADAAALTVDQETVNDAVAALALLRDQEALKGLPIYLLGHSQGAMLASYIGSRSEVPEGYILLAGSPRKLWEISLDQNLQIAQAYEAAGNAEYARAVEQIVQTERAKAEAMDGLGEGETVFGLPLAYQRHWQGIDAAALHLADQRPVLVLQGERDRQVGMADFALWQERLADHPAAEFISYPALNHLFGDYQGEPVSFVELTKEYLVSTPVDEQVMADVAAFITRHAQAK